MKKEYFVDETVLASLLKMTDEVFWKTAYAHYREPFVRYFEQHHGIEPAKSQTLFQEVFSLLVQGLKEGKIRTPLDNTLFAYLVRFGEKRLSPTGHGIRTTAIPMKPYLAGEVLVMLLHNGYEAAFVAIIRNYKEPIFKTLKSNYSYCRESPEEIFGESMMAVQANVVKGKLKLPLKSRLFTYTYRVAENKFLAFNKMMRKGAPLSSLEELERIFAQATDEVKNTGLLDHIVALWPTLSFWLEAGQDAFECLSSILDDELDKEILRLRFEEGLLYKEIGELLGIPEGTVRRRFGIILRKWRKIFFCHILKDAPHPIREYLKYYLIERWPFSRIAKHFGRPEAEIKRIIEDYLSDWRGRNGI